MREAWLSMPRVELERPIARDTVGEGIYFHIYIR